MIIYRWTRSIFETGYRKELEETDIYATLIQDRTSYLTETMDKTWKREIESCTKKEDDSKLHYYHLLKALLRCFGKPLLLIGIAEGFMELFSR